MKVGWLWGELSGNLCQSASHVVVRKVIRESVVTLPVSDHKVIINGWR